MDLKKINVGDEIFFVDKSEPGSVIYYSGTVVEELPTGVALHITGLGSLFAPGWIAMEPDQSYLGQIKFVAPDADFLLLSPLEFKAIRKQYEVAPAPEEGTTLPDVEPAEDVKEVVEDKDEDYIPKDLEEEAPAFEEEGLYREGSLKSVTESNKIYWPKGLEPGGWMDDVYNKLPQGEAPVASGQGGVERGGPAVISPGSKGPGIPPGVGVDLEKEFAAVGEKAQKAIEDYVSAEKRLRAAEEKEASEDELKELKKDFTEKVKAANEAKDELASVKRRVQEWRRPPDTTVYKGVPGSTMTRDTFSGRSGLVYELKKLSDDYTKTLDQINKVKKLEEQLSEYQEELDLILAYRKKKIIDVSSDVESPRYELVNAPRREIPIEKILSKLRFFKVHELEDLPFLWDVSKRKVAPGVSLSERDLLEQRIATSSPTFTKLVGRPRTFFDLTPGELEDLADQAAADRKAEGAEPLSRVTIKQRARHYANEYKKFIEEQVRWKTAWQEIQKFLQVERDLIVSDPVAKKVEKALSGKEKEISIEGIDVDSGEKAVVRLSVPDLKAGALKDVAKDFENRTKWLRTLQDGRKNKLASEKRKLRNLLIQRDPAMEQQVHAIDVDRDDLSGFTASLRNLHNTWAKSSPANKEKVFDSEHFKNISAKLQDIKNVVEGLLAASPEAGDNEKVREVYTLTKQMIQQLSQKRLDRLAILSEVFKNAYNGIFQALPINDSTYREAVIRLFEKYAAKAGDPEEVSKIIPKRYVAEHGEVKYREKLQDIWGFLSKEQDLQKRLAAIQSQISKLLAPYMRLEEEYNQYLETISVEVGPTAEDAGDFLARIQAYTDAIQKNLRAMAYLRVTKKSGGTLESEWKKQYEELEQSVEGLRQKRIDIIKGISASVIKRFLPKIEEYEKRLAAFDADIKNKSEPLDVEAAQLSAEIEKIRNDRWKIADQVGLYHVK